MIIKIEIESDSRAEVLDRLKKMTALLKSTIDKFEDTPGNFIKESITNVYGKHVIDIEF